MIHATYSVIKVKTLSPTDHLGLRLSASCDAGRSTTHWDYALSTEENYEAAALAMMEKLDWEGIQLLSGGSLGGCAYYTVEMVPQQPRIRQGIRVNMTPRTPDHEARLSASCDAGRRTTSWNYGLSRDENFRAAALSLVEKLGWDTRMTVSGGCEHKGSVYFSLED